MTSTFIKVVSSSLNNSSNLSSFIIFFVIPRFYSRLYGHVNASQGKTLSTIRWL
ncbi:MAG: hypothetical protein JW778_04025 [Candidatus Altiarchaeota archaeon]|nr:hypothetical protein [Candidatus Altiarchaeota archaeon]